MRRIRLNDCNRQKINYLFRNRGGLDGFVGDNPFEGYDLINARVAGWLHRLNRLAPPNSLYNVFRGTMITLVFDPYKGERDMLEDQPDLLVVKLIGVRLGLPVAWDIIDISNASYGCAPPEHVKLSLEGVTDIVDFMLFGQHMTADMIAMGAIFRQLEHAAHDMPTRETILRALYADILDNPAVEAALDNLSIVARFAAPAPKS